MLKVLIRSVDTCTCTIVRNETRYLRHGNVFLSPFLERGVRGCHPSTRQTESMISPRVCQSITGVDISYLPGGSGGVEGNSLTSER
jgi:hypothetical protein